MLRAFTWVAAICVFTLVTTEAQSYSPVVLLLRPKGLFDTTYVAPPQNGAFYVMFPDEPLSLEINVSNAERKTQVVLTKLGGLANNFSFQIWQDGTAVQMSTTMPPEVRERAPGFEGNTIWDERISLESQHTLVADATIGGTLRPGQYVIRLASELTDESGRPLRPQFTELRVEVRAPTAESTAERLRRGALRGSSSDA
jgi:hypothetical protein